MTLLSHLTVQGGSTAAAIRRESAYDRSELLEQRHAALLNWEQCLQTLMSPKQEWQTLSLSELNTALEKIRGDDALMVCAR